MLAELFDKLKAAAQDNYVKVGEADGWPHASLVRKPDGTYEMAEHPVPDRAHTIHTWGSFAAYCMDALSNSGPQAIMVNADGAYFYHDWVSRRGFARLELIETQRWHQLLSLENRTPKSIAQVSRLLRFDLHGTGVDSVITALRRVDFSRASGGTQSADRGGESMGRSIEAKVQRVDEIPETFVVSVPVFNNPGLREISTKEVTMGIDLDFDAEKVVIFPLLDEIDRAHRSALGSVAELATGLGGDELPVYQGEV